jgi:hypothetical protein
VIFDFQSLEKSGENRPSVGKTAETECFCGGNMKQLSEF